MSLENDPDLNRAGMRAVTFLVSPPEGPHPARQLFSEESGIVREELFQVNVLNDGTMVLLGGVRGDPARVEQLLAEQPMILGHSVSGRGDESALVYAHTVPPPGAGEFLQLPRKHEVFIDFPIEGARDGRLRAVLIGETNDVLQRALADLPPEVGIEVERIGPYRDESGSIRGLLTKRQGEVLDVALDLGYYEVPRRATHRDIAERMDLSVGTVGEHLQKIEARVFGGLAR
jgi:hypothetical protein